MSDHQMTELQRLRAERRLLSQDRLAINARLAAMWAAFQTKGEETPAAERAVLKARLTRIELELARVTSAVIGAENCRHRLSSKSLLAHLLDVLREHELEHLMQQAQERLASQAAELDVAAVAESTQTTSAIERQLREQLDARLAEPIEA